MSFSLENFVAVPSTQLLNLAKKSDLLDIADHCALTSVKPSMLKHRIKNMLFKFLVDKKILDSSALSSVLVTQTDLQLRELEIQRQIQLEKLKLEQEERMREETFEREEKLDYKSWNEKKECRKKILNEKKACRKKK